MIKNKLLLRFFFISFSCLCFQCKTEPKKITYARIVRDVPTSKVVNYPNGKTRLVIVYQKGSLSSIEYYSLMGKWDSIVYYKNARKYTVIHFNYHPDGSSERTTFKDGRKILFKQYNSSHDLIYQEPIDTARIHKTIIKFKSGSPFLPAGKKDTLLIINNDLPPANRGYKFMGVRYRKIESAYPPAFIIDRNKNDQKAFVLIYLHENNEHRQLLDSLLIPLK